MARRPVTAQHRDPLIGQMVFTADGVVLGTIAGVEQNCLVIEGRGVPRRVHVVPVAALERSSQGELRVTRTMEDFVKQRPS